MRTDARLSYGRVEQPPDRYSGPSATKGHQLP